MRTVIFFLAIFFSLTTTRTAFAITISDTLPTNIVQTEADVFWSTNEPASTRLYYGTSASNLNQIVDGPSNVTSHSIHISGLVPCTTYYLRARSTASSSIQMATSPTIGFSTRGRCSTASSMDTQPPSAVTGFRTSAITSNSVTLAWNLPTDNVGIAGFDIYGFDNGKNLGRVGRVRSPTATSITISGLTSGTTYSGSYGRTAGFMIQAFDAVNNYSAPSTRISFSTNPDCLALKTDGSNFSSQMNPTGDPVGGGACYRRTVSSQGVAYVVVDRAGLLAALRTAVSGQTIFIPGNVVIDLTGEKNLAIPGGVTLASDRGVNGSLGALVTSSSLFPASDFSALFVTGGDFVRITGIRLRGPNPDIWDHDTTMGYANGIRSLHKFLEVDNNEIYAWDKWAVWLYIQDGANIHHNHMHHTIRAGYGYPIWAGGAGSEAGAFCQASANLFEACRHCFASSGHLNSEEISYNVILRRQLYVNIDRHGAGAGDYGGNNTRLHHNLFFSTQQHFQFPYPNTSSGVLEVDHNWFNRSQSNPVEAFGQVDNILAGTVPNAQVSVHDNQFDSLGRNLPVAVMTSNVTSGVAPLTVQFDASGSSDADSGRVVRHVWRFGDGDYQSNETVGRNVSYTYTQPGRYTVNLTVYNAYGIPSNVVTRQIDVLPSSGRYVLSAWVKDSYRGPLSGLYSKQVLIDNTVVWQDDVANDEGWQHIVVNLDSYASAGSIHDVRLRMVSLNGVPDPAASIVELFVWYDDISVTNTNITNNGFETGTLPPWIQVIHVPTGGLGGVSTTITTADSRSGEVSYQLRIPLHAPPVLPGTYGEAFFRASFQ